MSNPAAGTRVERRRALFGRLAATFPLTFGFPTKPLAIGTSNAILVALPDVDRRDLGRVLGIHCSRTGYLQAMVAGAVRIDLDGKPAGEVTPEQAAIAVEKLGEAMAQIAAATVAAKAARKAARKAAKVAKAAPPKPPPGPPKLGLSDLKQHAMARKGNAGLPGGASGVQEQKRHTSSAYSGNRRR